MINTQYISLNMIPSGVMPVMYCSQYDIGRPLGMVVYNGSEAVDLDTYTCTIEATRTDGTAITAAVTTDDNIGVFTTTATMTNQADRYPAKLVLFDSNSRRVASLAFVMVVTERTMDENAEGIQEDKSVYQQYTQTVQTIIAQIRSDLVAEANARQSADNTLQSNINTEESTRASADTSLQNQINQIIAPSGEAPSAAEVQNARIGSDGTVYSTLGDAIRTQYSDLKSATGEVTYNAFSPFAPKVLGSKSSLSVLDRDTFTISPNEAGSSVSTPVIFSLERTIDSTLTNKTIYISGNITPGAGDVTINIGALNGTTFTAIHNFNGLTGNVNVSYALTSAEISANAGKTLAIRVYGSVSAAVTTATITTFSELMVTIGTPYTKYLPHFTADDAVVRIEADEGQAMDDEQTYILGNVITMSDGYVTCNANPVDVTNITYARGWKHAVISCSAGDLFTITAHGGNAARSFCFIDSQGTVLGFSGASVAVENQCVKAPNGAVQLIVNDNSGSVSRYGDASETYAEWHSDSGKRVFRTGWENYYLGSGTIQRTTSSRSRTKVFNVDKGKTYKIYFSGGDIRRIGFYDASYADGSATHDYLEFDASDDMIRMTITSTYPMMAVYYATTENVGGDVWIEEEPLGELVNYDMVKRVMQTDYDIAYANAAYPLMMRSYMNNNMNVHPSVKYFPGKLFGHKYWMAYTPYPLKSTYRENPCIAYSEDGYNWTNIAANPLDTPHGDNSNYNSDTHLVYNPETGLLECWYRFADVINTAEYIYRKTSADGLTWSAREQLNLSTGGLIQTLSPAVLYDSTNHKYLIWVVNDREKRIDYYESTTGDNWTFVRSITPVFTHGGKTYDTWHIDVEMINGEYVMLSMAREHGTTGYDHAHLFMAKSDDNITWTVDGAVILGRPGAWDSSIYRSCLVDTGGMYRIYYSALNGNVYGIGITESDSLSGFVGAFY